MVKLHAKVTEQQKLIIFAFFTLTLFTPGSPCIPTKKVVIIIIITLFDTIRQLESRRVQQYTHLDAYFTTPLGSIIPSLYQPWCRRGFFYITIESVKEL